MRDSSPPEYHRSKEIRMPVIDPVKDFIDTILEEDLQRPKKQRHTSARIYERLIQEKNFNGCERTVRKYISKTRKNQKEVFIPIEHPIGRDIEFDWGQAYFVLNGQQVLLNYFVSRLCFSGAIFVRVYISQNQESFLDGIVRSFRFFGGIAQRGIFDNLKTAVQKVLTGRNRIETKQFAAFQCHYMFEPIFCNVRKGNEKGGVEGCVNEVYPIVWTKSSGF